MSNYRDYLFAAYNKRADELDAPDDMKQYWFDKYVTSNYSALMSKKSRAVKVLDVGCSRGYLISSLIRQGFTNIVGIDLSSKDIAIAKKRAPQAKFILGDSVKFCSKSKQQFDIIIAKAVLEHIPKNEILEFLQSLNYALKSGGIVIIDVPNMDWLFASHERYMDFTHEVGFTKESLKQVMDEVFVSSYITPGIQPSLGLHWKIVSGISRYILGMVLRFAEPEGASTLIWTRSILGVGKK